MLHEVPIRQEPEETPRTTPTEAAQTATNPADDSLSTNAVASPQSQAEQLWEQVQRADPAMAALAQAFDLIPISTEGNCPF